MRRKLILSLAATLSLTLPALSETITTKGSVTTESVIMRAGDVCESGALDKCKPGQLCFANITIEGEAARALYDALKQHGAPSGAVGEFATKSATLACGADEGMYWCQLGYDAVGNDLSYLIYCQDE